MSTLTVYAPYTTFIVEAASKLPLVKETVRFNMGKCPSGPTFNRFEALRTLKESGLTLTRLESEGNELFHHSIWLVSTNTNISKAQEQKLFYVKETQVKDAGLSASIMAKIMRRVNKK
jgi:hypothetical protein